MSIVADQWAEFQFKTKLNIAPPRVRKLAQFCYYAGMHSLIVKLVHSFDEDREPTVNDIMMMESIFNELSSYLKSAQSGDLRAYVMRDDGPPM